MQGKWILSQMKNILWVGLLIRLVLIYSGIYIDQYLDKLNYTDVDYHIFSGAAKFMLNGASPYERSTYRYPPLLAGFMTLNHFHPEAGKIIFAIADVCIIFLIQRISQISHRGSKFSDSIAWIWAFNPISINICTRGSADSITNLLVLLVVYLVLTVRPLFCGLVFGLAVHLRIYPIIYLPALMYHLWFPPRKASGSIRNSVAYFVVGAIGSFTITTGVSYLLYKDDYLQHAIYYHLTRNDHRHNFSIYFYWNYLKSNVTFLSTIGDLQSFVKSLPLGEIALSIGSFCSSCSIFSIFSKVALFLPQLVLFVGVVLLYASHNLPVCFLLQTMIFVSYNKVITAQYFTWYLCLVPICMPSLVKVPVRLAIASGLLWLMTLSLWLNFAYQLEFIGENVFYLVWICSMLFHLSNVLLIGLIIAHV